MNFGMYGILIIFGAFVVLLVLNPRLSCFGKRVTSPLYPVLHKKKVRAFDTEDYGFDLGGTEDKHESGDSNPEKDS